MNYSKFQLMCRSHCSIL